MAMIPVNKAEFADPEEGVQAAIERLISGSQHYLVTGNGGLATLVGLTAMATGSPKAVALSVPERTLDGLEKAGLIRREQDKVVLL